MSKTTLRATEYRNLIKTRTNFDRKDADRDYPRCLGTEELIIMLKANEYLKTHSLEKVVVIFRVSLEY